MKRVAMVVVLAFLGVAASCGNDGRAQPAAAPTSSSSPRPATAAAQPNLAAISVRLTRIGAFDQPLAMAWCPGRTTAYIAEKTGRVRLANGRVVLDLSADVSAGSEQGLLGIACSPDGRFFYVHYTNRSGDTRVEELPMPAGDRVMDRSRRRIVLGVPQPASNHNGGHLLFGPDRKLWIGLGDGGGGGDTYDNGQNRNTLLGSILRIEPRPSGARPYTTPADNPFARGGGRPEIAIYGARNPWRFSFDRATGDLWIGDVGQGEIEEIDRLPAGRILGVNLGWPAFEGNRRFRPEVSAPGAVGPVYQYDHDEGQSVVGGHVYRGNNIPALRGAYLFADTYAARLRALALDGTRVRHRNLGLEVPGGFVSSFAQNPSGELYVLSLGGGIYRIDRR